MRASEKSAAGCRGKRSEQVFEAECKQFEKPFLELLVLLDRVAGQTMVHAGYSRPCGTTFAAAQVVPFFLKRVKPGWTSDHNDQLDLQ